MTRDQMTALQSYISSVVRVMTQHSNAHASNIRLYLNSKAVMEAAFGIDLPNYGDDAALPDTPVDLFADVTATKLPDLL